MKKLKLPVLIFVLIIIVAVSAGVFYSFQSSDDSDDSSTFDFDLADDFIDGVSITYQLTGEDGDIPTSKEIENAIAVLSDRIETLTGSDEFYIYKKGSDCIKVVIPGASNSILDSLSSPFGLYFIREYNDAGEPNYYYSFGNSTSDVYMLSDGVTIESLLESGDIILTAEDIADAQAAVDSSGSTSYVVSITLTSEGTAKFADATKQALENGWTIGIYYQGSFISVPSVITTITDGKTFIAGFSSYEQAENFVSSIQNGVLDSSLKVVNIREADE